MDLNSFILLLATKKTDPNFIRKISKHIDRYGTMDINDGKVVNSRYFRLFALNSAMDVAKSKWHSNENERLFIIDMLENMIRIEATSKNSFHKNSNAYKRFYDNEQAINYALKFARATGSSKDKARLNDIGDVMYNLDRQDADPSEIYFVAPNGYAHPLDGQLVRA